MPEVTILKPNKIMFGMVVGKMSPSLAVLAPSRDQITGQNGVSPGLAKGVLTVHTVAVDALLQWTVSDVGLGCVR